MKKRLFITYMVGLLLILSACKPEQISPPTPTSQPPKAPTATASEPVPTATQNPPLVIPTPSGPVPVIFDDDGSPDGTAALLYLLSHPQADLKAINISYGEAHPEIFIQHIGRMLASFGIKDIPLGYGQDAPLAGTNEFPEGMRQEANAFWRLPIPNAEKTYPAQTTPELMVSIINQSPEPVTIFISGPCTNLAQALRLDPNIRQNISAVYIMGGAAFVPGNIADITPDSDNKAAEWNIYADPQAAKEVFESGMNIYLVPLDATNQVLITKQDILQWRQGGEIADFAADIYDMLLRNWNVENGAIWDLMTALIMLAPDHCKFQPLHLQVITEEGEFSGQTAVVPGETANSIVCLEPDADKIRQTLINIFSSSENIPTPVPSLTPIPTDTPAGLIFREDFTQSLQAGWEWQNENPLRWIITPQGWLQIMGEDPSLLANDFQSNLLCRKAPTGDFQITLHLSAEPKENFQQATLYLYHNGDNYIAMNRGFCGPCFSGGSGMFMEYKIAGSVGSFHVATQDTDVYLRLVSQEQTITGYYAFEPEEWERFGKIGNYLEEANICLGVSNVDAGGISADLVGRFDYLEITQP